MALATDHAFPIRFGRFSFDFGTNRLFKGGRELPIQEQPATLLAILLSRPGDLVTREELQARLWPDKQFLEFDAALNTTVKRLRQVLKDDAATPQFIQTVPKKGYRFIGELHSDPRPNEIAPALRKVKVVSISQDSDVSEDANQPGQITEIQPTVAVDIKKAPNAWFRNWVAICLVSLGLVLILVTLLTFVRPRTVPELVERQLTSNSTEDPIVDSALSPDGKYLAYVNWRHVFIVHLASRDTHTLTNLDKLHVFRTIWTHDSTHLMVVGYERLGIGSSLWNVSLLGFEDPEKLADNVYDARESSDGKYLAFVSADLSELSYRRSGSGERTILYAGKQIFSPAWSADNERIWLIDHLDDDWRTLRSISIDRRLPPGPTKTIKFLSSLVTLPQSRLVYAVGDDGVLEVKTDPVTGAFLGSPVRRLQSNSVIRLSASADGTKLAYQKGHSESDVFVGDLSNGNMRLSNTHRLTLDDASDYPHAWTKDSRNVLFESDRSGSYAVYSQPFDGADVRMLVTGEGKTVKPVTTPDGRSLLYLSIPPNSDLGDHAKGTKVMRLPMAGGPPSEVFSFEHPTNFHCPQQDGKLCILEERMGAALQYSYLDPVRGKLGPFRGVEQVPEEIDWDVSPDGSTVAVLPRAGEDDRIWLFKGSEPRREIAVTNAKQLRSLNWWADGKGFFMASFGDGKPLLMTVPLSGQASLLSREILSVPSWAVPSPDGKHLAFVGYPNNHKAWMVDNF